MLKKTFGYEVYLNKSENMATCLNNEKMPCPYDEVDNDLCLFCLLGYMAFAADELLRSGALIPISMTRSVENARRLKNEATDAIVALLSRAPGLKAVSDRILHEAAGNGSMRPV